MLAVRTLFTSSNSTFPMNCNHRKPPPDPWALYVLAAVGALCFAVVLSMLTGCTTTRTVERVTVHRDTLHVVHRDTLRELRTATHSASCAPCAIAFFSTTASILRALRS